MIYRIRTHNYLDSKQILYHILLCQSILSIHTCIYLYSTFAYYHKQTLACNLHVHLHVSCRFMCLVSLVLDIKLNTPTFTFLITSRTHIFAYG